MSKNTQKQDNIRDNIIQKTDLALVNMINRHSKVIPVRVDLRLPRNHQHNGRNSEISRFHKNLDSQMRKKGIDHTIVTVREQNKSHNPHYHALVLFDGNKVQNSHAIKHRLGKIWKRVVQSESEGLTDFCKPKQGHTKYQPLETIIRPSRFAEGQKLKEQQARFNQSVNIARQHAEYLAKGFSKGNAGSGNRELLGSQIV